MVFRELQRSAETGHWSDCFDYLSRWSVGDFIRLFVSECDLMSNGQGFRQQSQVQAFIDSGYVGE